MTEALVLFVDPGAAMFPMALLAVVLLQIFVKGHMLLRIQGHAQTGLDANLGNGMTAYAFGGWYAPSQTVTSQAVACQFLMGGLHRSWSQHDLRLVQAEQDADQQKSETPETQQILGFHSLDPRSQMLST